MKFGKRLQRQIEVTLPEWRDKFLSYKDMKKLVRLISVVPPAAGGPDARPGHGKAEAEFIYLLNEEIEKFNAFFVEQEEDFIIRQKELKDRIQDVIDTVGPSGSRPSEAEYRVEMSKIRRHVVDFHGEMVLLENYSNVNYTGLAKIVKKYDKRTGRLLRLPFIENVLKQPFFTTDLISKLVKDCESTIDAVLPATEKRVCEKEDVSEGDKQYTTVSKHSIFQNTVAALTTMRDLRGKSSTVNHFSLPPLNLPDVDVFQSLQPPSPITT